MWTKTVSHKTQKTVHEHILKVERDYKAVKVKKDTETFSKEEKVVTLQSKVSILCLLFYTLINLFVKGTI